MSTHLSLYNNPFYLVVFFDCKLDDYVNRLVVAQYSSEGGEGELQNLLRYIYNSSNSLTGIALVAIMHG